MRHFTRILPVPVGSHHLFYDCLLQHHASTFFFVFICFYCIHQEQGDFSWYDLSLYVSTFCLTTYFLIVIIVNLTLLFHYLCAFPHQPFLQVPQCIYIVYISGKTVAK